MNFEPPPANDFEEFIDTYFEKCRETCPKLRAIAGKWRFEDLVPGLSDFDTRFLTAEDTTIEDWAHMSLAVGRVHTRLAREQPRWARILEHLPGLNLTAAEVTDPLLYYPEIQQWTFYRGDESLLASVRQYLGDKPWSPRDELFHLKRFATYYGPYQRGIDPAVNVGRWESKYPLHSRFMHYFVPPVQSAVSLVERRGVRGKLEAMRTAREVFPNPQVIDTCLDAVDRHYEIPEYYEEPRLREIESMLDAYLREVYAALADHVTLIEVDPSDSPEQLRSKTAAVASDAAGRFHEGARFCRLMKGRLLFYGERIPWFETDWLIRNELERIVKNFHDATLTSYGRVRFGQPLQAEDVLERIGGMVLAHDDCQGMRQFANTVGRCPHEKGRKQDALAVAEVFDPVLRVLETLGGDLHERLSGQSAEPAESPKSGVG